jgi:hypothetical protein
MMDDTEGPIGGEREQLYSAIIDEWAEMPRWYRRTVSRQVGAASLEYATIEQLRDVQSMLAGCHR